MHLALKDKPEDFFITKQFVKEDAPKDALIPGDQVKLKGKFLRRSLRKGDHVTFEDIMEGKFGLQTLPDGMRAVGIRVNPEQIAGGFASLPGSRVDIVWMHGANDKETFAKILLENVAVLAADANQQQPDGGAMVASVVTVALHPDDATKLTLAMGKGSIRLLVRNLEDTSSGEKSQITISELLRDHTSKQKKDVAVALNPTPDPVERIPEKTVPVEPPQNLRKMVVTVKNGNEYKLGQYWVDDDDRVVAPPPGINSQENDRLQPLSTGAKKDDAKDGKKSGIDN
jgi:Flp pilus assembly protein CpaB